MMTKTIKLARNVLLLGAALAVLAACGGHLTRGDELARKDEWSKAILEYRQALNDHPEDIEIKSRLKQSELKAADYYYHRGLIAVGKGDLDGAIGLFQEGLVCMPENAKLQAAIKDAQVRKDAAALYQEGMSLFSAGKLQDAKKRFKKVLELYPDHKDAMLRLADIEKQETVVPGEGLALSSSAPITLNFRETDIRDAYEFLARSFGVNVIFDDGVKNVPVTLFAKDVTFEQGLGLLLATSKTFYRRIGPNSILVAMDSKDKRGQYEDMVMRTYSLNTVKAKEMADTLKGLLVIKKIVINEELNTITIRDTEEIQRLAERIIQNNDKKPAEVILEVEILEIDRTKADNLGLDFGSYQISASVPTYPLTGSFQTAASTTGLLTLPSATLHFFKQDVDAKTLANPRVRVLSGKPAKIHIGDRVPLIATTIQDATGQVRNTFDYKDIGIGLTAEPAVHLDNSVTVKLGLVVSSLGQNLGTASQPAFSIGSRDAETFMLLRDGETAILGGLIQDAERSTKVLIPGLGEIPAVGSVFTNYNDSVSRTDVLLTITPHVVRGWEQPSANERQFYSGTENGYVDRQLFAEMKTTAVTDAGTPVAPHIDTNGLTSTVPQVAAREPAVAAPASAVAPAQPAPAPSPAPKEVPPQLGFSEAVYEVAAGQDFSVKLTGQNLTGVAALPLEIIYNAQVVSFVGGEAGNPAPQSFNAADEGGKGVISVKLAYAPDAAPKDASVLASLSLHAASPGVSYLMYRTKAVQGPNGETINAQVQASRVVVK